MPLHHRPKLSCTRDKKKESVFSSTYSLAPSAEEAKGCTPAAGTWDLWDAAVWASSRWNTQGWSGWCLTHYSAIAHAQAERWCTAVSQGQLATHSSMRWRTCKPGQQPKGRKARAHEKAEPLPRHINHKALPRRLSWSRCSHPHCLYCLMRDKHSYTPPVLNCSTQLSWDQHYPKKGWKIDRAVPHAKEHAVDLQATPNAMGTWGRHPVSSFFFKGLIGTWLCPTDGSLQLSLLLQWPQMLK